ncbi:MAG: molecular chaperone HtpG [Clostridia bacterium]|nr:molecular chaperone HtpG [Clostridia bacterium]
MKHGTISVDTENIFPVIKKWLYSDKDIFLRELVSNGCDAVTKFKKLVAMGNAKADENEEYSIEVILDKEDKTIKVIDNGLGMTESEVIDYIASVAFSGAEEFVKKYQEDENEDNKIIGHFGLGFYSAFMVSERVDINTLSFEDGAKSVFWTCDGSTEYEISDGTKTSRGTEVILHIADDSKEFLEKEALSAILQKYCAFFPIPIYFYEKGEERGDMINDTDPLWLRKPADCKEEEYNEFYKKVFPDFNDPLFYIHLNVEYPFNLKGILYFPKLGHEFQPSEGQIKLFNNQVFVADNVKEIIPEFLLLLKGVIDCPDLPLNVSRSFLQNDGYAAKVSAHITKKVADKLTSLYNTQRESFESYWDDIAPFVKYGCLKDPKFYDKIKDIIIYKTTEDKYETLPEYLEKAKENGHENEVYYASDALQQAQYIEMFKRQGTEVVIMPMMIDNAFIAYMESQNEGVKFKRIDSALASSLKDGDAGDEKLVEAFKEAIGDEKLKIETSLLKSDDVPAVLLIGEDSRRLRDMALVYGSIGMSPDMFPSDVTLTLNLSNPLIKKLSENLENKDICNTLCKQIYDIARLTQSPLDTESLSAFLKRSADIMNIALGADANE